jgi:hypothetical protein
VALATALAGHSHVARQRVTRNRIPLIAFWSASSGRPTGQALVRTMCPASLSSCQR